MRRSRSEGRCAVVLWGVGCGEVLRHVSDPVRPAPIRGLTSNSIVPHAPIDSLPFSVFNHARALTSGV